MNDQEYEYRTVDTSTLEGLRQAERMKEAGELATFRGDNSGWRIVEGFSGLDRVRFQRVREGKGNL